MIDDPRTERIIGLAMKIHRVLGPGFLESVYRRALVLELRNDGLKVGEEQRIPVWYAGALVGEFVADIVVDDCLIVELKAAESLSRAHEMQTVNYLVATGIDVGLLINFGAARLQCKRKYRDRKPFSPVSPVNPVEIL